MDHTDTGRPRVTVRRARPRDAAAIAAIYAPWVLDTRASLEVDPPSTSDMASRIAATQPRWPWLVAEDAAQGVLGYAYGGAYRARNGYRWTVEVSAYIASSAHRRGIGRRLYVALLGLLAAQGHRQAVAGIGLPNPASVAFHEAMGFRHVGTMRGVGRKFAGWQDVGFWQRELGDGASSDPAEPLMLDDLAPDVLDGLLA